MKTAKEAKLETTNNINNILNIIRTNVKIEIDLHISNGEYVCSIFDIEIIDNKEIIKELNLLGYKLKINKDLLGVKELIISWK